MDTDTHEMDITAWKAIGLMLLYFVNYIIHNYNAVMGNIFITLSVIFLIWKMRNEYLKDNKNADTNTGIKE
jgi:hypothetical protein